MSSIEIKVEQLANSRRSKAEFIADADEPYHDSARMGLKRVGIKTLGCKVNAFESELIAQTLKTDDWKQVDNTDVADLYLINTCTVTREADRQARQEVRKVVKLNPDALVIVTGCYAQMDPQACADIPGVDLVLGNDRKLDAYKLLPKLAQGDLPKVMVGNLSEHLSLPDQILSGFDAHTRAFVQIQQGCDQGCTFCIIHVARGPSRSLAPTLIKRQVERLAMNGYPEIVICGVDLGSYGEDFKDLTESFDLVDLLEELLAIEYSLDNPFRIRLSSIDPHHITDRLIDLIAKHDRMCPQFHLSLQSGSTLILKRMKRRYDASHVRERIAAMRAQVPELVLSADVMVGFPTETEVEFSETLKMVEDINIAFPHVFSYSERDGTPAARIPSNKQVPVATRKHRNKRLRELGNELKDSLLRSKVNSHSWVLPEKPAKQAGFSLCRGEDYVEVLVPSEQVALGKWQKVLIKDYSDGLLIAE